MHSSAVGVLRWFFKSRNNRKIVVLNKNGFSQQLRDGFRVWLHENWPFLLVRPAESDYVFWTFLDAFKGFWEIPRVSTCYEQATGDAVHVSLVCPVCRYVFTIYSGQILNQYNESFK